jgi:hypothetical protein
MRILLKLELDCTADAAWRALHSPRAITELYGPLLEMGPMSGELPTSLEPGTDVPVEIRALGFIPAHPKIPDDAFMVKRLPGYSPDLAGRIVYPAAFDALGYQRPV